MSVNDYGHKYASAGIGRSSALIIRFIWSHLALISVLISCSPARTSYLSHARENLEARLDAPHDAHLEARARILRKVLCTPQYWRGKRPAIKRISQFWSVLHADDVPIEISRHPNLSGRLNSTSDSAILCKAPQLQTSL